MPRPEGQAGQRTVTKAPSVYSIHSQRHGNPVLTGCSLSGHAGLGQREKPILTSISGPRKHSAGKGGCRHLSKVASEWKTLALG